MAGRKIFLTARIPKERARLAQCTVHIWKIARRKLDQLDSATLVQDLKIPSGNKLELLTGDRKGQYSIKINDQYRICFEWQNNGPESVEIIDYHKG